MQNVRAQIGIDARVLEESIRDYSRSQVELWQQVPFLAHLVEQKYNDREERLGRLNGYEEDDRRFMQEVAAWGYLGVGEFQEFLYTRNDRIVSVDLETGKFYGPDPVDSRKPVSFKDVLALANHLDELNAGKLVAKLKKEVRVQSKSEAYLKMEQEEWRDNYRSLTRSTIRNKQFADAILL